jgi:hypothetical protein
MAAIHVPNIYKYFYPLGGVILSTGFVGGKAITD